MGRRHKHPDHEEHENHEAWVIPYADMLTLLMGLFLVMWSMGATDLAKMKAVGRGFASEIGIVDGGGGSARAGATGYNPFADDPPFPGSDDGTGTAAEDLLASAQRTQSARAEEQAVLTEVQRELAERITAAGLQEQVTFRIDPRGLVVVATEGLFFASGSARLEASAVAALDAIAGPLLDLTQPVVVEGHTDDRPAGSGGFATNWELSTARATSVLRTLIDRFGFPAQRLSAVGYADTVPVADNATTDGRSRNRRVEILVAAVAGTPGAAATATGTRPGEGTSAADAATAPATPTTTAAPFDPIGDPLADPVGAVPTEE